MKQSSILGSVAIALALAFTAPATAQAQDLGLVTDLAGIGVTTSQASGGLLAIMQLAQTNLGPADFGKLMGMLPEMSDFMGAAGGGGAAAGAMGAAAGAMGGAASETADKPKTDVKADKAAYKAPKEGDGQKAHHAEHKDHADKAEEDCCGAEMGDAAGGMGGAEDAMGGAAGAMGGAAGGMPQISGLSELAAVPSLVSAFSGLGLGPEMIQQFVPIILKYVMGSGGDAAAQLLGTGLGLGLM